MGSSSFLAALGFRMLSPDGAVSRATGVLGPGTWAKGVERPRLGALATMADIVAGLRPEGALIPTVDLDVQLVRPLPANARIDLECRPLKEGRRLFVGEVLVRDGETLLARAVATFINRINEHAPRHLPEFDLAPGPFDGWFRSTCPDERTVVVERTREICNGPGATVQGGAQATIAELAAEWALAPSGPFTAAQLGIRYLGAVTAGPVAATAETLAVQGDRAHVSVRLTDAGAGDRLVAYATVVCHREP